MNTQEETTKPSVFLLAQLILCSFTMIFIWSVLVDTPKNDGPRTQSRALLYTYLLSRSYRH